MTTLRRKLYSADSRLVEAAGSTERASAGRPLNLTASRGTGWEVGGTLNANQHIFLATPATSLYTQVCLLSQCVEVDVCPAEKLFVKESLTVAPEHMDVQLLEEVHDERVDLRQQPHEEDDGEAQGEDCGRTNTKRL